MLEHFCECYSDLSGPILCPVLGSITPLFIPNSRIRPIRLIGLCASFITFCILLFLGYNSILLRPNLNLWKAFDGFLMKTSIFIWV